MHRPSFRSLILIAVVMLVLFGALAVVYFSTHRTSVPFCQGTPSSISIGGETITVRVADTPASRVQGLSGTASLATSSGMLFVFSESGEQRFWMKDMAYAIDIIWIGEDWRVLGVVDSASPASYPNTFTSPSDTRYVLEVPAKTADRLGVEVGSRVESVVCGAAE